ncbi:MFS transporter [Seleniivibrio sp.]|uniref:MFS transporter n=1 Tax=Seleniivibrio sp. TaxID=2898801 RepID=UPI0025F01B25|nr:MFS transporter [Seleniivibrio sp.]MCD8554591.1 MFS transporter [Seleniivibrio sp.]
MAKYRLMSFNMLLLFFSMSLFSIVEYSIIAIFPVYISENMDYSRSYIGLFIGIFSVSALFIKFFIGYITDRIGRKTVFIFGLLLCIACTGLYYFAAVFMLLLFVRLLHGVGSGAVRAIYPALTIDIVNKENAGRGLGLIGMTSVFGMLLASSSVFYIIDIESYRTLFALLTITGFILIIPVLFIKIEQTQIPKRKLSLECFIEYRVLSLAFLRFVASMWHGLFMSYAVIHARNEGVMNAGVVIMAYALGNFIMRPLAGYVLDKRDPGYIAWLSYVLYIIGYYIFGNATDYFSMISGGLLIGFGVGVEHTMLPVMASKIVRKESIGRANSTLECAYSMGIVAGAVFCGKITESMPLNILYTSVGVMNIIPFIMFYMFVLKSYRNHILK